MRRAHAQASRGGSFEAVDDFESMLGARISSTVEQFAEELKSVVGGFAEAGKQPVGEETNVPHLPKWFLSVAPSRKRCSMALS